ncbi:MAG: hypothetical protein IT178_10700 [Acidobacteria bacterium]|nr:hypothetical protein [Acidobacteriota bacterium]
MQFSVTAWAISVAAVVMSAWVAWREGHWARRPGLDLGFRDHGGMWGDFLLLPIVNALAVPHLGWDRTLAIAFVLACTASWILHALWHGGQDAAMRDHMWPARTAGHWRGDLSLAGWCHVLYVIGELTLLLAFALSPAPTNTVVIVLALLALHVTIGLFQPGWRATGRIQPVSVLLWMAAMAALSACVVLKGA